jgi:PAS domain S-box-containing protein
MPGELEEAGAQIAELQRSLEAQGRLLQSVADFIWRTDFSGHVLYVNAYVEKLLGYPPARVLGRPIPDYYS